MARFAYVVLSYLLAPVVAGFLLFRGLRNPAYLERFPERFGFAKQRTTSCIWVHAVSVGEVQAASGLVRALRQRYPDEAVVVTTVTPTGARRVEDLFGDDVMQVYAPYDLPGAVRRFFDRLQPKLAIIIETELWPNLYQECGRRKVPLVLASARISPRSVNKYRRFVGLFREALSHGIVIAAQGESDAERFRSLGANPARTHTTGNIKFDLEQGGDVRERGEALRRQHAPGRFVWVAGSTHEGEEALMLDAHARLRASVPDALLMLAPRHPERFAAVGTLVQDRGYSMVTRSSGAVCSAATDVFLVDTLGELTAMYAAADVAFVGGSLVPIGGHNLLEPAALARPILTGPHTFNAEDIATLFVAEGAAERVHSASDLAECLHALCADRERARRMGERGYEVVQQNRGALERLLALIDPLVTGAESVG